MTLHAALARIATALEAAGIPYMITGSVANAFHVAPRATQDIDLVIDPWQEQLDRLVELLPEDGYLRDLESVREAFRLGSRFTVLELASGWKFDLIIRSRRRFNAEEFDRRMPVDVAGLRLFVVTPEDLVISKLEQAAAGGSQRHVEDVALLLKARTDRLDVTRIERWVRELGLADAWARARGLAGMPA